MRILLADDDHRARAALQLLLMCEGEWSVIGECADSDELLAKVIELKPDTVILDWELTGSSQTPMAHVVRALDGGARVIALSSQQESRQVALSAGADAFVSKAEPPERLLAVLQRFAQDSCPGIGQHDVHVPEN
jgi:DNA-binding NarL/FixJ family response regulator